MHISRRTTLSLASALCVLGAAAALAGDGMTITIDNNTTKDLVVSVYDQNTSPPTKVLSGERINSFASIKVTLSADDSGRGHLSWTATTGDRDSRRCGRHDKVALNDGDTVHVYANSQCAPP